MGYIDFSGAGCVHLIGGFGGLMGTIMLGPRTGIFESKESLSSYKRREFIHRNRYAVGKVNQNKRYKHIEI